jgi:hypothetical protein
MPISVEAEALQMAAAMLPRATAVKAMAAGALHLRAGVQLGRHQRLQHGAQHQAQHREQHEGAGHYQQMQPPVAQAGQHRLARELGAVHEEQQGHHAHGGFLQESRGHARGRRHAGQHHGGDKREGEVVGKQAGAGHGQQSCEGKGRILTK